MVGPARELGRSAAVVAIVAHLIAAVDASAAGVLWWTAPAAGFLLLAFFVPVLAAALVVRVAARSWWPVDHRRGASSEVDGRRAAVVLYAGAGAALAVGLIYNAAVILQKMTSATVAAAGATALVAVATVALIGGLAPPICRLLGSLLSITAPRLGRLGPALLSRRAALTWVGLALVAGGYLFFRLVLSPRLDDLSFPWMAPATLGCALVLAGHALLPPRLGRAAAVAVAGLSVISVTAALVVRHASPRVMLDLWADTGATAEAVSLLFDLEPLHDTHGVVAPKRRADTPPVDVVVITVDTWRADRTPPFGKGASMPELARFASRSVRFDAALAPSNNTRRSVTSMMIGAQPSRIRGRIKGWALALDPRHTLVAERFRAAGYQTVGFFCCRSLFDPARGTGFSRGIDRRVYLKGDVELAAEAADFLTETLATEPGADRPPVFAWIHLLGPHGWYRGSAKLPAEVARRRYDRALGSIDRALAELLEPLEDARDRAVIVLTSDHGEGLADHGAVRHSSGLYQSQLHVPLLISAPGIEPRAIAAPVSLIHLAPTLLELAGFEAPEPPAMDPGSLAPLVRGEGGGEPVIYAEQIRDRSVPDPLWAVVAEGHKLIVDEDGTVELYDLRADPAETKNLAGTRAALERRLREALERRRAQKAHAAW